jgi:hypothetical protein
VAFDRDVDKRGNDYLPVGRFHDPLITGPHLLALVADGDPLVIAQSCLRMPDQCLDR